jgi:hypothetical protein
VSEQVRLSAEKVEEAEETREEESSGGYDKLTTSRIAEALGLKTGELTDRLFAKGWLERDGDQFKLTDAGKRAGGEFRFSKKFGPYFIWPKDITI